MSPKPKEGQDLRGIADVLLLAYATIAIVYRDIFISFYSFAKHVL